MFGRFRMCVRKQRLIQQFQRERFVKNRGRRFMGTNGEETNVVDSCIGQDLRADVILGHHFVQKI